MKLACTLDGEELHLEVLSRDEDTYRVRIGDRELTAHLRHQDGSRLVLDLDGRTHAALVARDGGDRCVAVEGEEYRFVPLARKRAHRGAGSGDTGAGGAVTAPMPGKVLALKVEEGDPVEVGQPVIVLEAMKMENELRAPTAGTVTSVHTQKGDTVTVGQLLLEIGEPEA